jgi:hypothetical protein
MATSPNLVITYGEEGQEEAGEVTFNNAVNAIDALVMPSVKDKDLTTPPAGVDGNRYIVGSGATGAWSGEDGNVAVYYSGWIFYTPKEGWRVWVDDENAFYIYDGSAWFIERTETRLYLDGDQDSYIDGGTADDVVLIATSGAERMRVTDSGLRVTGDNQWLQVDGSSVSAGAAGYLTIVNVVDTTVTGTPCTLAGDTVPTSGAQAGWLKWVRDASTIILVPYWI